MDINQIALIVFCCLTPTLLLCLVVVLFWLTLSVREFYPYRRDLPKIIKNNIAEYDKNPPPPATWRKVVDKGEQARKAERDALRPRRSADPLEPDSEGVGVVYE